MREEIDYAMTRQEGLGIPMFKQDFAYRLVKLNQVDKTMWETDFVQKVQRMVEDLEGEEKETTGNANQGGHLSVPGPAPRRSNTKNLQKQHTK